MGKIHLLSLIINMNSHPTLAYGTKDASAPLERMNIERRELRDNDVEMQILYCGICHSDLHSIHNDWGHTTSPLSLDMKFLVASLALVRKSQVSSLATWQVWAALSKVVNTATTATKGKNNFVRMV